jgi:MFS family permease
METVATTQGSSERERWNVIMSSSLGTSFEWYDFLLYGALAPVIAKQFFSGVNETAAFIFALLTFSAGFVARPFGSLVFGAIGDVVGRKRTFVATIVLMALPTFLVGLLPTYATWGIYSPIALIVLRVLQGLAVGGEYGGALVYVAEHSKSGKRGFDTSWLCAMTPVGIILALSATLLTRTLSGETALMEWAWRIPFLGSILLFGISMWLRLRLKESPIFLEMKAATSREVRNPIREAFGSWRLVRTSILLTFGVNTAIGVLAYTAEFYTQFFMGKTLGIDGVTINWIMLPSLLLSIPLYIAFGWLTDKLGRKPVFVAGALLGALTMQPAFKMMTHFGNPALEKAQQGTPVVVRADPKNCSLQFNPVGQSSLTSSCDIAKSYLANRMISYTNEEAPLGETATVRIGKTELTSFDASRMTKADFFAREKQFEVGIQQTLAANGYPLVADPEKVNRGMLIAIITYLLALIGLVYTSGGAWMTELFPTRIRYTAISLPYNIGAGWFGGFVPSVAFAMVAANGGIYFGLWYPIVALGLAAVISLFCLPETKDVMLDAPIDGAPNGLVAPIRRHQTTANADLK